VAAKRPASIGKERSKKKESWEARKGTTQKGGEGKNKLKKKAHVIEERSSRDGVPKKGKKKQSTIQYKKGKPARLGWVHFKKSGRKKNGKFGKTGT